MEMVIPSVPLISCISRAGYIHQRWLRVKNSSFRSRRRAWALVPCPHTIGTALEFLLPNDALEMSTGLFTLAVDHCIDFVWPVLWLVAIAIAIAIAAPTKKSKLTFEAEISRTALRLGSKQRMQRMQQILTRRDEWCCSSRNFKVKMETKWMTFLKMPWSPFRRPALVIAYCYQ